MIPEELPGYRKKSFLLYYNGGEIWFEHLECLFDHEDLVLKKLHDDMPLFTKPSSTSFVCFVFFDTFMTDAVILAVEGAVLESKKQFAKIAFCGLGRKDQKKIKKILSGKGLEFAFFEGLEEAKVWLLP